MVTVISEDLSTSIFMAVGIGVSEGLQPPFVGQ